MGSNLKWSLILVIWAVALLQTKVHGSVGVMEDGTQIVLGPGIVDYIDEVAPGTVERDGRLYALLNTTESIGYRGCYKDKGNRDLSTNHMVFRHTLTPAICFVECAKKNHKFAGLQNGYNCYCGDDYGKYGEAYEYECDEPCQGDASQNCGGKKRNRIFELSPEFISEAMSGPKQFDEDLINAEYKGCFRDKKNRDLTSDPTNLKETLTPEICFAKCAKLGYKYAGLQYRWQCFCGHKYGKHGSLDEERCKCACAGDATKNCGCAWSNKIYELGTAELAVDTDENENEDIEYKGCFKDARERDLSFYKKMNKMTPKKCFKKCQKKGYKFAGLQYRYQCFCGDSYGSHGSLPEADCKCPCKFDKSKMCGCAWSNKVYQLKPKDIMPQPKLYSGLANYKGCFLDEPHRDLQGLRKKMRKLTPDRCFAKCSRKGFKYAGLQNGKVCFCGDSYNSYGSLPEKKCEKPCKGDSGENCGGKWANSVYELVKEPTVCDEENVCGLGAVCKVVDLAPVCSCKPGVSGDPHVRCCNNIMNCGCWGDPHCHTFDGAKYDFQGACKYDLVSTDCAGKNLPAGLEPFNVKQKQELRQGKIGVAFIQYLEINVYGNQYRMNKFDKYARVVEINGMKRPVPYTDTEKGIRVFQAGRNMVFSSEFGLAITWNGRHKAETTLCDAYANATCGLCGNGDGDKTNEFVDRTGSAVEVKGSRKVKYFRWGSAWRTFVDDESTDQDGSQCSDTKPIDPLVTFPLNYPEGPMCIHEPEYSDSKDWCAAMSDMDGAWAQCASLFAGDILDEQVMGCTLDMCVFENDPQQNEMRCAAYESFNSKCIEYAKAESLDWNFNWRSLTNCPMQCGDNMEYAIRTECPKTCTNQDNYDCGAPPTVEGCFCKEGFVLENSGLCIEPSECGCLLPDNSTSLTTGQGLLNGACDTTYYCSPTGLITRTYQPCSPHSKCLGFREPTTDQTTAPIPLCGCKEGYKGDGHECVEDVVELTPCDEPDACGTGASCEMAGTEVVCSCKAGAEGDANVRCCHEMLRCGCWGDPHCHTFDKSRYDFQGSCKYDLVSTDCYGKTLPVDYIPFNVRQRHELRDGRIGVSMIQYVEINVFGIEYRLLRKQNRKFHILVNGLERSTPYNDVDNAVRVYVSGRSLFFSAEFGLTIQWNGNHQAEVYLCDAYKDKVCGLCGNANGNSTDDFVDRMGDFVPLEGQKNVKYFKWGSEWKTQADDPELQDIDGSLCKVEDPIVQLPESPPCKDGDLYANSNDWCAAMNDATGPWDECIKFLSDSPYSTLMLEYVEGCTLDMCTYENETILQNEFRCSAYADFDSQCNEISAMNDLGWAFNWRDTTNCPMPCGVNMEYGVRNECPLTCTDQTEYECGETVVSEGCFCKEGFVLDNNDECVTIEQCGCLLPDGSATIPVGSSSVNEDCSEKYTCMSPQSAVIITLYDSCSMDAVCTFDGSEPICTCIEDYIGNGFVCFLNITTGPEPKDDMQCQAKFCYAYGDPHYRSSDGVSFTIDNTCSYFLAKDSTFHPLSLRVIIDHERRYNIEGHTYMKTVRIHLFNQNSTMKIGSAFTIDGVEMDLPWNSTQAESIYVYRSGEYIVFDAPEFNVQFDGDKLLKVRTCFPEPTGLCDVRRGQEIFPGMPAYVDPTTVCDALPNAL